MSDGPPRGTAALGRRGERVAGGWLRRHGYRVIGRNVLTPAGEADIVCEGPVNAGVIERWLGLRPPGLRQPAMPRAIVVVEVKSRDMSSGGIARPEAQLGSEKRDRLRQIAQWLARRHGWLDRPLRVEAIAVEFGDGPPIVRHHTGL